jgi:hypothetical protein
MRRHHNVPLGSRILLILTTFALLVAPAAGFDLEADPGSVDASCCCPVEEAPPTSCCEEPELPVPSALFVSDLDCACQAPSPPAPTQPAPAPHGPSAQLSSELSLRVQLAASSPSSHVAVSPEPEGTVAPPRLDVLTEDLSVLHRRAARGTSVVLAFLSVARI